MSGRGKSRPFLICSLSCLFILPQRAQRSQSFYSLYEFAARIVVEMDGGGNLGDVWRQGLRHEDTEATTAPYCWCHSLERIAGIVRPYQKRSINPQLCFIIYRQMNG